MPAKFWSVIGNLMIILSGTSGSSRLFRKPLKVKKNFKFWNWFTIQTGEYVFLLQFYYNLWSRFPIFFLNNNHISTPRVGAQYANKLFPKAFYRFMKTDKKKTTLLVSLVCLKIGTEQRLCLPTLLTLQR